jgi:Outer membrane protein Omp28/Secretion system C-terminal sorting domain
MKKIFTLMIVLAFATIANAQYYYFPNLTAGENPKGLNTDVEQPTATGWTTIASTSATPVWSTVTALPGDFTFNFNGSPVTSYKVSTSGVMTFTTSAVAVPSSTNQVLPSASIPDNSIMVWGLAGTGANDIIRWKVFGNAPNRQYWVQFCSYSAPGASGTNWTYWGIVLEEGSNDIYFVDQRTYLTPTTFTIGIQVDGSNAYTVSGAPNTASVVTNGGNADTHVDNAYYRFINGVQPANDITMNRLTFARNAFTGSNVNITGEVFNFGTSPITSFTLKYLANNQVQTASITGVNIASGASYNFTHSTPFTIPDRGPWDVKVWAELAGDANVANDTLIASIYATAFATTKRVLFEEATGTWCQWCPRGAVYMDSLHKVYPTSAMLVAVHNNDPMEVTEYDASLAGYIPGYPSGLVDRKGGAFDPSDFFTEYNNRINGYTPCDINVNATYNAGTRQYNIDLSAIFADDLAGDLRFNVVVVEDGVKGTGSGYNQVNAYSGGGNGAMGNYHNLPNPVPAAQMVYDHVARAILGNWVGTEASLPNTVTANSTHTFNYTYTLPVGINPDKVHIIAWVTDANTGEVFNANEKSFSTGVSTKKSETFVVNTFPNPSNGTTTFEVKSNKSTDAASLEIYDLTGRLVYSSTDAKVNGGSQFFVWNANESVANGIYQATIKIGSEIVSSKVVLTR